MSSVIRGTVHTHTGNVKSPTIVRYFPVSRGNTHDNRFKGKNGKFLRVLVYKSNGVGGHLRGHVVIMDIENWSKEHLLVFSILYPNSMDSLSRKTYKSLLFSILDMSSPMGKYYTGIEELVDSVIETQKINMVKHNKSTNEQPFVKEDRKKTLIDKEKKINLNILYLEKQIEELEKNKKKIKTELKKIEKKEKNKKKKQEIQATMSKLAEQLKALEEEELEEEELEEIEEEELEEIEEDDETEEPEFPGESEIEEFEHDVLKQFPDDIDYYKDEDGYIWADNYGFVGTHDEDTDAIALNPNYEAEEDEMIAQFMESEESKHDGEKWCLVDGNWTSM